MSALRVAVIGSGPAGVYAAAALTKAGNVEVDVLDRLPAPYGLVRYGVAPDHVKMKSVDAALRRVLEDPAVRFLGNVDVGTDITREELATYYDAVVFATGAAVDRRLDVPGEDLHGSFSATDFVAWYSGHPDAELDRFTLTATHAVVIGAGNVAVDVARVLTKTSDLLASTDVPGHVLDVLAASAITDVTMVARRGPAHARFTTKELRELGEITGSDIVVDPADLELSEAEQAEVEGDRTLRANLEVLRDWAGREPEGRSRTLRIRFWLRPAEVLGTSVVDGFRAERTVLKDGRVTGTGETLDLPAQMVLRSVGYRVVPPADLPLDPDSGTVPHDGGRVLLDGRPMPGVYVAGWLKRGPSGIIGTNKPDATETVTSLLADAPDLPRAPERDPDAIVELLLERKVQAVGWTGWEAIDAAEKALGEERGECARVKIADRDTLLKTALGA
ncbi:MAG TPA: FAD-dependent oxidoreductase [Mycobacteriales bacterium]|nr:FAD-dependent oxidoreductase [Mycobacteriales bacterium]